MGDAKTFVDAILGFLVDSVAPVADALEDPTAFVGLLADLGWSPEGTPGAGVVGGALPIGELITTARTELETLRAIESPKEQDLIPLVTAVTALTAAIATAGSPDALLPAPLNDQVFWEELAADLPAHLLALALARAKPVVLAVFRLFGVITTEPVPSHPMRRPEHERWVVHWDNLGLALSDPGELMKRAYGWGGTFKHLELQTRLLDLARLFGIPAWIWDADRDRIEHYYGEGVDPPVRLLRVPLYGVAAVDEVAVWLELGLDVFPVPEAPGQAGRPAPDPTGLVVSPYAQGGVGARVSITEAIAVEVSGLLDASDPIGLKITPTGASVVTSDQPPDVTLGVALVVQPPAGVALLGTSTGTGITLQSAELGLELLDVLRPNPEIRIRVGVTQLRVHILLGGADSFLGKLTNGGSIDARTDLMIAWSSRSGLRFDGSGALELVLGLHAKIGTVEITELGVAVEITGGVVGVSAYVSGKGVIGPVAASVAKIGARLELRPGADGPVGGAELGLAFRPPEGLGLRVNAGPVTGGGFISFDPKNGRYAGILQIRVMAISVTVIGLLDTKLPGDEQGFSFLLIVAVKFSPIQLGYGFTLNGVGGLAGINRTIVVKVLQDGVRTGSVDHILFPEDPVRDAPQLISDLRAIFPPAKDRYVFGPMVALGWGASIIELQLGIVLELPMPIRILILGQINVALPTPDEAVVELHLDVLGVIDFGAKMISIDASLHDSRIAAFDLWGDMAMRLSWGEKPVFVVSIGGFHPAFPALPDFPKLRRLTIALGTGENPRIGMQTYLAITANTAQVGARAEIYAEAGGYNIYGWLGFDALLTFEPFKFEVAFGAGIALRRGTTVLAGIHLEATLTGPTPFRIVGEAAVSVLFFEVKVAVDHIFGESRTITVTASSPWGALKVAVEDKRNWSALLPPFAAPHVTITVATAAGGAPEPVLVDPLGGLALIQKEVPLDRDLTMFGQGALAFPQRFAVRLGEVQVGVGGVPAPEVTRTAFAPAQFEQLDDAAKLSRPSFEDMDAGLAISSDAVAFTRGGGVRGAEARYETVTIEKPQRPPTPVGSWVMPAAQQASVLGRVATARGAHLAAGLDRFAPGADEPQLVGLAAEEFVVASADDLAVRTDVLAAPAAKGAASAALDRWLAGRPEDRGRLQVVPVTDVAA
jgi:hypothetical protein